MKLRDVVNNHNGSLDLFFENNEIQPINIENMSYFDKKEESERFRDFIAAVENELKMSCQPSKHDGWRKLLLGERITDVRDGVIDENAYIAEWLNA